MRRKIEVKLPKNKGLDIRLISISMLNPAKYNPRKDLQPGDKAYTQLEKSIKEFGNVDPIIWNETTGNVVGGHQRLKVLRQGKSNGDKLEVSVVNLPERKEKMLNIALNKISGDWDNYLLKSLLEDISLEDFEMDIIGFDRDEIEKVFGSMVDVEDDIEQREQPILSSEKFIEIYCSNEDLEEMKPILNKWGSKDSVTVNIS